jgi:hypothetical protein
VFEVVTETIEENLVMTTILEIDLREEVIGVKVTEEKEGVTMTKTDVSEVVIDVIVEITEEAMILEEDLKETQLIQSLTELDPTPRRSKIEIQPDADQMLKQEEVMTQDKEIVTTEIREVVINQLTKETEEAMIHRNLNVEILDLRETISSNEKPQPELP